MGNGMLVMHALAFWVLVHMHRRIVLAFEPSKKEVRCILFCVGSPPLFKLLFHFAPIPSLFPLILALSLSQD